jgi:DNA replicative helicase MCM subunit Mcm2 (Cdc46/Mcm family)
MQRLRHELENALEKQRRENLVGYDSSNFADNELIPARMHRKFQVVIVYRSPKASSIRSIGQLNSSLIGSLVVLKGIVIRTD